MAETMQVNPQRAKQLSENLSGVLTRIQAANKSSRNIRLVAVSKLKPATDILALHQSSTPHSHFGENYLQELQEKARLLPRSINWHFIGALQTNKCRPLAESVPNLWCVSSVDTAKKAEALEKGRANLAAAEQADGKAELDKLKLMVQVNTSGEAEKSGCEPTDTAELCRLVRDRCPHLKLQGLMTIGAIARSMDTSGAENEDFKILKEVRDSVAKELGIAVEELELSMGMSADYEVAIEMGSDEVRVGSTIFGERPPKKEAKVLDDQNQGAG